MMITKLASIGREHTLSRLSRKLKVFVSVITFQPVFWESLLVVIILLANLINKLHQSCVAGHSHIQDVSVRTAVDGKKMLGIVAGCYTHPESHGDWNFNTYKMWYRGVTMLYDVHDGFAEGIEFVTQDRIKRLYA